MSKWDLIGRFWCQFNFLHRLIKFRSAFQGGRRKRQRSRLRKQAAPQCRRRIKPTWKSKHECDFLLLHCFLLLDFSSSPCYHLSVSFAASPLRRSSSVSSEGTTAKKETNHAEGEEAQRDEAAPAEELVAAAPPAVPEVPAHLQKQVVRKLLHPHRSFWLVHLLFPPLCSSSLHPFRSQRSLTLTLKTLRTVTCAPSMPRTSLTTSNRERWAELNAGILKEC